MTRIFIYLFPALMDLVIALALFVCPVRAAREFQLDAVYVGGMLVAWGVAYMVACPLVGRIMNRRNAARLLVYSCLAAGLLCIALTLIQSAGPMFAAMVVMGGVGAFFFAPFQIFMAAVDEGGAKPITFSTGMYTFSWSMGFAAGPFVAAAFAMLGEQLDAGQTGPLLDSLRWLGNLLYGAGGARGWQFSYLFAAVTMLFNAVGILLLARHAHPVEHPAGTVKPTVAGHDYSRQPNYVLYAWIGAGVGIFTIQLIRGVFPKFSDPDVLNLPEQTQGMVFFLLSLVQAFTGLALCWSKTWMYRALPVAGACLFGVVGLLLLGLGTTTPVFLAGAACYGIYSGCFFFYFVFHAIAHPDKAPRQVGTNEALVGVMGIAAPFLGGLAADHFGMRTPFVICAILVLGALAFQGWAHRRGFLSETSQPTP
ncbi:MAG: MFS transporter [Lentisphaeria bacterium]|jgi:MFS family permease|nr:MFS transporter [Lentisphaeria bacterium]